MKKTGKALSLVLSLALVVSSLAMSTAGAATAQTENLPATVGATAIDLVNGQSGSVAKTVLGIPTTVPSSITNDNLNAGTLTATEAAYKSGANILSATVNSSNQVEVKLASDNAIGTETLAVRYTATSYRYTNPTQPITFSEEVDYTINVHQVNSYAVIVDKAKTKLNKNAGAQTITGKVVKWTAVATNSLLAVATPVPVSVPADNSTAAKAATIPTSGAVGDYFITVYSNNALTTPAGIAITTPATASSGFTVTLNDTSSTADYLNAGTVTIYAAPISKAASAGVAGAVDSSKTVVGTAQVLNQVGNVSGYISSWHGATWASTTAPSSWKAESDQGVQEHGVYKPCAGALNISGCDISLSGNTEMYKGNVGNVTAGSNTFTIDQGGAASITSSSDVTVQNGNVGAITSDGATATVTVNGGTTGNISAFKVLVNAADEKVQTRTGSIAATTVSVGSDHNVVATGAITESGTADAVTVGPQTHSEQAISLTGSQVTVPSIDCANYKTTINLNGYKGSIAAPLNAAFSTIQTNVNGSDTTTATLTGAATLDTVDLEAGTLTVANSLNVNSVIGSATLVVPAGAMKINKSINAVSLKLSNANLATGMTAFYAPAYTVYDGSLKTVGYTLDYDTVNNGTKTGLQAFNIKSVVFAGLVITPVANASNNIVQKTSATYQVSAYPGGTSLPAGDSISFSFSGSSSNFTTTNTANTITINAKAFEPLFSSLNKGTITATLVDANNTPVFGVDPATYDVQVVEKASAKYTSDTTADKTIKVGEQYTYKITSSDGSDPNFGFGTNGIANIVKSWKTTSGTTTFYYYTIQGMKEGAAGAYTNTDKAKVNVVTVKGSAYTSDTSKVTIKAGGHYTFKITAGKGVSAPVFQVCTFSAKNTVLTNKISHADGSISYYYTITANASQVGNHGAYVNGVNVALVTVVK